MKKNKKLGIVIGHTKQSPGRKTPWINEYALNKELAKEIDRECKRRGIDSIVIHRNNGYNKLPDDINKTKVDYCICVHHNGYDDPKVNGTETLRYHKSETSKLFAEIIQKKMVECLNYKNRGLHAVDSEDRGGHVLKYTSMPCILIEPYFTTHEPSVLNRNTESLAKAIVDGYEDFLRG